MNYEYVLVVCTSCMYYLYVLVVCTSKSLYVLDVHSG